MKGPRLVPWDRLEARTGWAIPRRGGGWFQCKINVLKGPAVGVFPAPKR